MLFNSLPFIFLFPLAVLIYSFIPGRLKHIWLLVISIFFYCFTAGSPLFLIFPLYLALTTWITGDILCRTVQNSKKYVLYIGLILNFAPLFCYKALLGAAKLGLHGKTLNLLVPLGLSFFTLQSTTYVISCYKKEIEPEKSFLRYFLFVIFFPCVTSGPVERAGNILPQIEKNGKGTGFDPDRTREGLIYMLWGFFLKMVIASRLEILTDMVYQNYTDLSGTEIVIGVVSYSIELYADFAGYSSIALGTARILGYDIMDNFRQPGFSASVTDFWRRWHISLSSWLRDYIYIPLGGSRRGEGRRYLNIMFVFLVSGLWHGVGMTFVIWGLLHGIYQVIELLIRRMNKGFFGDRFKWIKILITNVIVILTWIPFRSISTEQALGVFKGIFRGFSIRPLIDGSVFNMGLGSYNLFFVCAAVLILFIVDMRLEKRGQRLYNMVNDLKPALRWAFYYLLIIMILFSTNLSSKEFLYQNF